MEESVGKEQQYKAGGTDLLLSINTNRYALAAARSQAEAQTKLDASLKQLSSGKRINSAADDSAGLQIANRLNGHVQAGMQVSRNLNDGISYGQIAEGGLSQISDVLQRMRVLSIQAQSGIYSTADRQTLDVEFQQLKKEIDAIAYGTKAFSRLPLVSDEELPVSEVPRLDDLLTNGVAKTLPSGLQSIAYLTAGSENLVFNLNSFGANDDIQVFTVNGQHLAGTPISAAVWRAGANGVNSPADLASRFFYPENGYSTSASYDDSQLNSGGTSLVNGMTFTFSGDGHPGTYLESLTIDVVTEPLIISVVGAGVFEVSATWDKIGETPAPGFGAITPGGVSITASVNSVGAQDFIEMIKTPATISALGIASTQLDPLEQAAAAVSRLDSALAEVSAKRSYYGAKLNQMQTAQRSINSAVEFTTSAKSRIEDADFAKGSAELIRNQLLQDTSSAVLAQANAAPAQIIALLQNSGL